MDKLVVPEQIETARLLAHRLRYEDADEIFHVYASKDEATRFVSWPTHQSIQDTRTYLHDAIKGWTQGKDFSFGIRNKENGRFIGNFGILNDLGKIQFGYILGPVHWGNGFATEICMAMMKMLRSSAAIHRIGTFIDAENAASAHVLLKCGLVEEARLQKWFRFVNQGNQVKDCVLYRLEI